MTPRPQAPPARRGRITRRQFRREAERLYLAETGRTLSGRQWRKLRKANQREEAQKTRERLARGVKV